MIKRQFIVSPLFIALISFYLLMIGTCSTPARAQYKNIRTYPGYTITPDTIPSKKYRYFIRVDVPPALWGRINYVKDSIVGAYQAEMGNKTLGLYFEHENYLRQRASLDSVEIVETKKK